MLGVSDVSGSAGDSAGILYQICRFIATSRQARNSYIVNKRITRFIQNWYCTGTNSKASGKVLRVGISHVGIFKIGIEPKYPKV